MNKKRVVLGIVGLILFGLIYLQFRTWRHFDWSIFFSQTGHVNKLDILVALLLIYFAYGLRAVRWKIFLRPVSHTTTTALLNPTIIGFTGLALLGRAGELIRPYLIARATNLPFSSQLAVWAVERIFDIGAFAILLISAIFLAEAPTELPFYEQFRVGGIFIVGLVIVLTISALVLSWRGDAIADWISSHFTSFGQLIAIRIREFRNGLNTIHSFSSLLQLVGVSLFMWGIIALAYWEVLRSYGAGPLQRPLSDVPLLMASSMVGSLIQLPGVGGGSQLATIGTLQHVFQSPHELAASCGILLWLVTFVSIVPLGLVLAHGAHVSLSQLSEKSHSQEEEAGAPSYNASGGKP